MKVGVLLPGSTMIPALGYDFMDGIKACLKREGILDKVEIITTPVGFGIEEAEIYAKTERLLFFDKTDIVIGFIDYRISELIQPLFNATGKLLIVVSHGANYPENWIGQPGVIHHTLNFAFCSYLTGKLPARDGFEEAIFTASYYDGGYFQCYAMINSYLLSGGRIKQNYITQFRLKELDIAPLQQYVSSNTGDRFCFLSFFSGDYADWFLSQLERIPELTAVSLYTSPTLLAGETNGGKIPGSIGLKGYTIWYPELNNDFNTRFQDEFAKLTGRKAQLSALLGWETGLIVSRIFSIHKAATPMADIMMELTAGIFESPRGWFRIDAANNHSYSPVYLLSKNDSEEKMQPTAVIESNVYEEWSQFISNSVADTRSGWENTYLCI